MSKRYQALLELARDVILFIAPDGCIVAANDAALSAYGYTHDEICALTITDLRSPLTTTDAALKFARAIEQGILFETVHRRKDGTLFPVEVSSRMASLGGEEVVLSVIRDISERKRVEAELARARQELEERVQDRTRELAAANAELRDRVDELSWAQRVIVEQARELGELSMPVIELWDALLVAPIVGEIDDRRMAQLTYRLLHRVTEARAATVLLDVTGVAGIDASTARALLCAVAAVRLLGASVILTGVRPVIAQALVELGIDLGGLEIRSTLAAGLREAFARRGLRVVSGG